MSVLNGISANRQIMDFVLWDFYRRNHILPSILKALPTDMKIPFTTGVYNRSRHTFPCIQLSASGDR